MAKPGFIQHPWTEQRGDSVSATCVIKRIENEAIRGCGLYYEIYHYRVICQLLQLRETLNFTDRKTLTDEAKMHGFNLDESSIKESRQCYSGIIRDIHDSEY
ncbi:hypothetical protein EDF82_1641 [Raoultella sp. BIGb0399]|uniref:hypothetical protein n=1 Tax=Raoultella sp. BIGb0399 TaxID=2485119 RepID=UPI000F4BCC64|nr:hypothetical protein [Raoultella sp. BIGb0399]ROS16500.1 hypothetical protein EDF82_1641 [Raoultella sp. BIGb0399]